VQFVVHPPNVLVRDSEIPTSGGKGFQTFWVEAGKSGGDPEGWGGNNR